MAKTQTSDEHISPDRDSSVGLVLRLNRLWEYCDHYAMKADYANWNITLNALHRNLLFREDMVYTRDNEGKLTKVELSSKDDRVFRFLSMKVERARKNFRIAEKRDPKTRMKYLHKYYATLDKKDIFVRKVMQRLKLYLKESKAVPGTAGFGNF